MKDIVYNTLYNLQKEREKENKEPVHILQTELFNTINSEIKKALNELYKECKIEVVKTLNQNAFKIKISCEEDLSIIQERLFYLGVTYPYGYKTKIRSISNPIRTLYIDNNLVMSHKYDSASHFKSKVDYREISIHNVFNIKITNGSN